MTEDLMQKIVSLCKRRGFVYPNSEIYGGLSNAYDYGPLGAELLRNIRNLWWKTFVGTRENIYGMDGAIISNPKVWEASGHVTNFNDPLVDCKDCKERIRADHLVEDSLKISAGGKTPAELTEIIKEKNLKCPKCGSTNLTEARKFNLLFKTSLGSVENTTFDVYLRGETDQNIYVNFKNIVDSFSPKIPFGVAQIGKAFRNEITPGNFVFRTLEFEQMEIEYFIREEDWENVFEEWKGLMWEWAKELGLEEEKLRWRAHSKEELSHYSKRTEDIEYDFPFGSFQELYGLAYRTDFDLTNHAKFSGQELSYFDTKENKRFVPHVVEPTFGVTRTLLAVLLSAFTEEKDEMGEISRTLLKLPPNLAPYKVAVFPLMANRPEITAKAREVYDGLKTNFYTAWDDAGNVGKRYRRQDEIGTPWCVTIDYQTLEDDTVTVRDRDSMEQIRFSIKDLKTHFFALLN